MAETMTCSRPGCERTTYTERGGKPLRAVEGVPRRWCDRHRKGEALHAHGKCSVDGCDAWRRSRKGKKNERGYCHLHQDRIFRDMNPKILQEAVSRFFKNTVPDYATGCLMWVGGLNKGNGRPQFHCGILWNAHRWAYAYFIGGHKNGFELSHLCDNKECVNPLHLEPTNSERNRSYKMDVDYTNRLFDEFVEKEPLKAARFSMVSSAVLSVPFGRMPVVPEHAQD
ncbi:HNH endonuclease [Brevibacterium litoralis]|uniref:HNH endonuclease n=1 Tax=Brevibacterium litoralis TaxID=3138935 RepID=UPI0032ECC7B6